MNREEYDTFSRKLNPNTYPGHENQTHQWFCQQHAEEFWSLLNRLSGNNTRTILEIGSAAGGTLAFFDQLVGPDGIVIGMEPDPIGGFSAVSPQYSSYKPLSQMTLITGYSYEAKSYDKVKAALGGRLLDFLFIDGDHSYEGAKSDFQAYSPLVRDGGIVGFHDIGIMPECRQAFDEAIGARKEVLPIHYMGIGLVWI